MPNVLIEIGKGVEVAAEDALAFFERIGQVAEAAASPRALLAFAVLLSATGPVILDATGAAAAEGLNIALDLQTAALIVNLWPELDAWAKTLAIRPATPAAPQGAKP